MRMWMVNPKLLCRKHLLGEHGEIHKFRHSFVKQHKMGKRVELGQIDHTNMESRHDELRDEMLSRGYNHNSDYVQPDISYIKLVPKIDINLNLSDLSERCEDCKRRIEELRSVK